MRNRVIIENVRPQVNGGRFPIKRAVNEDIEVTADIFVDGHDRLQAALLYRPAGHKAWAEVPMKPIGNDEFRATFTVLDLGHYEFTVEAWTDRFSSWLEDLRKKYEAGQNVSSELLEGAELLRETAGRITGEDADAIRTAAAKIGGKQKQLERVREAKKADLGTLMAKYPDRTASTTYDRILQVVVERKRARFGAWYEMFPRSAGTEGKHGTFADCENRLTYIRSLGFDILYLPPVHPTGTSFRKGPNNTLKAADEHPGSPWAIGSHEGGHKAVHPQLGTMAEFDHLVSAAQEQKIEIALDLALQCSPDHPYVREHPEWFRRRPDGSIKYAENPPKKYQDIYPLNFECTDWQNLWNELKSVVLFWIEHGVRIFRVDNPHTKSFRFWEWLITEIKRDYPDTIFLAEAFTRPKVMRYLAKIGFSQSYTYFTWRNSKEELTHYFSELYQGEAREYMQPNLFANTPDILHEYLQFGGRAAFQIRLVLAATLSSSYGIYGPPFELCVTNAIAGTEEYQDSEKYQIRSWNLNAPGNIPDFITKVNEIRRENAALHSNLSLRFHSVDNDQMVAYSKESPDRTNTILVVVNLDPHHTQRGSVQIPFQDMNLSQTYEVHELIQNQRYLWKGDTNFVELDPKFCPAHIYHVKPRIKTEHDFDYFL